MLQMETVLNAIIHNYYLEVKEIAKILQKIAKFILIRNSVMNVIKIKAL